MEISINKKIWGGKLGQKCPNLRFKNKDTKVINSKCQLKLYKRRGREWPKIV